MREYRVQLECKINVEVVVKAENPDDAYNKAFDTVVHGLHSGGPDGSVTYVDVDALYREVEEEDYA